MKAVNIKLLLRKPSVKKSPKQPKKQNRNFNMQITENESCCALGNIGYISHAIFEGEPGYTKIEHDDYDTWNENVAGEEGEGDIFAFQDLTEYVDKSFKAWNVKAVTYTTLKVGVRDGLIECGWKYCGEIPSKMGKYPIYLMLRVIGV